MAAFCSKQFGATAKKVLFTKSPSPGASVLCFKVQSNEPSLTRSQSSLTDFKRGRGGRSSFSGIVATVFGANGFLGQQVVNELGKCGSQVIIPYRRDASQVRDLKLCGDLGQILFHPFNLKDEQSIRAAIKHSNVVINLMGKINETSNFTFDDVHHVGPAMIARICREMGVSRLMHVSAINASTGPPSILSTGSRFLISKRLGELAVMDEFPDATVLRPSDMFGMHDQFQCYYSSPHRRQFGCLPLWKGGKKTIKQPVYVADVAEGLMNALFDRDTIGKTYECVGPERYYLRDIIDHLFLCLRWSPRVTVIPINPLFVAPIAIRAKFRKDPFSSPDRLEREFISDVLTGCPTLKDLGVPLTLLSSHTSKDTVLYRRFNFQEEFVDMFSEPEPPLTVEQRGALTADPDSVYY